MLLSFQTSARTLNWYKIFYSFENIFVSFCPKNLILDGLLRVIRGVQKAVLTDKNDPPQLAFLRLLISKLKDQDHRSGLLAVLVWPSCRLLQSWDWTSKHQWGLECADTERDPMLAVLYPPPWLLADSSGLWPECWNSIPTDSDFILPGSEGHSNTFWGPFQHIPMKQFPWWSSCHKWMKQNQLFWMKEVPHWMKRHFIHSW